MDASVSPCDDFYQYANGSWLATHPIPPDQSSWNMSSATVEKTRQNLRAMLESSAGNDPARTPIQQKTGDFYASCTDVAAVDAAGIAPIQAHLERIDRISDRRELQDAFADLHLLAIYAPFTFGAAEDVKDTSRFIGQIDSGVLGLPGRDDYLDSGEAAAKLRNEYSSHIEAMFRLSGIRGDATSVISIETSLAEAMLSRAERRANADATYNKMAVSQLSSLAPSLDWPRYFARIGIDPGDVNVSEPEFVRGVNRLIESTSLADWRTYLKWRLLSHAAPALATPIAEEDFRFRGGVIEGLQKPPARPEFCVGRTEELLGDALAQEYVARHFDANAKRRATDLVDNLIAELREDLVTLDWMSEATRREALAKIDGMVRKIGYPDAWRDYRSLEIKRGPFASNLLAAYTFEVRRDLAKIGKPVDRTEWAMTPTTWNAYNNLARNEIVFPAAILQWPRFDPRLDDAFNYGSIGYVIGHELTHAFDDQGRQYDAQGEVRDWWTPEDAQRFQERAACLIRQFEAYEAAPGLHHKGKLVAGESIADLGGLVIAWRAWQRSLAGKPKPQNIDGFTPEQRFFLAFAQARANNVRPEVLKRSIETGVHPVSRLRVNGPLSNLPDFASAFQCKSGDPMVRADRCRIW